MQPVTHQQRAAEAIAWPMAMQPVAHRQRAAEATSLGLHQQQPPAQPRFRRCPPWCRAPSYFQVRAPNARGLIAGCVTRSTFVLPGACLSNVRGRRAACQQRLGSRHRQLAPQAAPALNQSHPCFNRCGKGGGEAASTRCGRHDIRSSIGNQPPIGNQLLRRAGIAREHIAEPKTSSRRSPLDHGGRSHLDTVFIAVRSTRSFGTAASARCSCRSRTSARDCVGSRGRRALRIRCAYRSAISTLMIPSSAAANVE